MPGESSFAEALDSHLHLTHRVLEGARASGSVASCTRAATTPSGSRRDRRWCRLTLGSGPIRTTDSARLQPRRCAACITIATASRSPACASAPFGNVQTTVVSWRCGCRPATRSGSSTPACSHPTWGSRSSSAYPTTLGGGGISNRRGRSAIEPVDDAERLAAEIEATPPTEDDELDGQYVGGSFTR